jgi:hypothetical protein
VVPADGQHARRRPHLFSTSIRRRESVIPDQRDHSPRLRAAEFKVETLAPGPHRIIAVMANGAHIP